MDKAIDDRGALSAKTVEVPADEVMDEFDIAFDTAAGLGDNADLSAADDPKNLKEEVVVQTPEEPAKPEVPAKLPEETEEKYEQRWKTLQGIHKHDKEAWESEKTQLLSQLEEAKKPKAPDAEPAPKPTKEQEKAADAFIDSLTDDQKKQLEEYEKDFDTVSKMEGLKRSMEMKKLRKEMDDWKADIDKKQSDIDKKLTDQGSRLSPIVEKHQTDEHQGHFNAIKEAHNDYETYRDDGSITKWIESKPKYLQPALKETYSNGTADDVIDLISDFKKDNNIQTEASTDTSKVVNIDAKKAERKQALTSVPTKRSAVNASKALVDDFEGAFEEAVNKIGG
jgi:hypothetical protein